MADLYYCSACGWSFGPNHAARTLKKCPRQAVPAVVVPRDELHVAGGELRSAAEELHLIATGLPEGKIERRCIRNLALDLQQMADEIADALCAQSPQAPLRWDDHDTHMELHREIGKQVES